MRQRWEWPLLGLLRDLTSRDILPVVNFAKLRRGFILHIEGRTWLLRVERSKRMSDRVDPYIPPQRSA